VAYLPAGLPGQRPVRILELIHYHRIVKSNVDFDVSLKSERHLPGIMDVFKWNRPELGAPLFDELSAKIVFD